MNIKRKPWEEYPHLWKTESAFWTYVRGSLRRALWDKSPIKLSFKNEECELPPIDYTGRAKSGKHCALSGVWEGKSKLEVDHKIGNVSLRSWEDLLPFILHLIPEPNTLQLVTKEAHKIKSYAEKHGISFERAAAEKKAIEIQKEKRCKEFLEKKGVTPQSNAKKRRQQIVELLIKDDREVISE